MTPIKHVVVIFQENVSFDHYFGTYPNATNPPNEPSFTAAPDTPTVNGLSGSLLTANPNELVTGNSTDNPARLDRTQPVTCDNDHDYTAEQAAFNGGLMNMFPEQTSCSDGLVMDYYDGNTVTALWNYAQNFALNDNAFGTTFGPSTPGALNVVSGLGGPGVVYTTTAAPTDTSDPADTVCDDLDEPPGTMANGQLIGDIDPTYDDCSYTQDASTEHGGHGRRRTERPTEHRQPPQHRRRDLGLVPGRIHAHCPIQRCDRCTRAVCGSSEAQVGGTH